MIVDGTSTRLPEDATARPRGLNGEVSTEEMSGEVLRLEGVELLVKTKTAGEAPLEAQAADPALLQLPFVLELTWL